MTMSHCAVCLFYIVCLLVGIGCAGESDPGEPTSISGRETGTNWTGMVGGVGARIEIPPNWNGELILYVHGLQPSAASFVQQPPFASELRDEGYAWAASAFSQPIFDPLTAAGETVKLYEYFEQQYGKPNRTLLVGESMGGAAAAIAAEASATPFDGALALCSSAGTTHFVSGSTDVLGLAAEVSEVDLRLGGESMTGVLDRIWAELDDPSVRATLVERIALLSGGRWDDAAVGIAADLDNRWDVLAAMAEGGILALSHQEDSTLGPYEIRSGAVSVSVYAPTGHDFGGHLQIPLLTVHNSGDPVVFLREARAMAEAAMDKDRSELLVQRVVRSSRHCEFTQKEFLDALSDLVEWVDLGVRPDGDDLLGTDPALLGTRFTDPSRLR